MEEYNVSVLENLGGWADLTWVESKSPLLLGVCLWGTCLDI